MVEPFLMTTVKMSSVTVLEGLILCLALIVMVLNVISFYLIAKCKKLAFQVRIFSLSLACTDFLKGFIMFVRIFEVDHTSNISCPIMFHSMMIFILVTCFVITYLAGDRFLAIRFPLHYQKWMTVNISRCTGVTLWISAIIISLAIRIKPEPFSQIDGCNYGNLITGGFAFPLLASIFGVIIILNIAFYIGIFLALSPWKSQVLPMGSAQLQEQRNTQKRILLKILGMTGLFVLCYYPFMLVFVLGAVWNHEQFEGTLFIRLVLLWFVNSLLNPFVYVWRYKECRYQLHLLVCCWNKEKREAIEEDYRLKLASNEL